MQANRDHIAPTMTPGQLLSTEMTNPAVLLLLQSGLAAVWLKPTQPAASAANIAAKVTEIIDTLPTDRWYVYQVADESGFRF